ncbi:MAG: sigma-70 family RNA polymerase sigma factor, partial [Sedimentisphaerales bacterium]|nr:sigma-70 family RNA polymerase sigma factor [Sedimentisphaerales bacterium]
MIESEFILLRQFASNGDAEAFAKIIKQHAPMVYGVCLRILQDKDKAADAVQDTFFQLIRDAAEITGSLPNWLHRVATYRAIDLIRTDSQRKQRESIYTDNYRNIISQNEKAAWREISGYIDEELDNLDELTREVLILHFFEGQTMTSIGEKFGISQQTVSRRIDSGVVSLRQNLKSRGVIVPAAILSALLMENIVQAAPASIMRELGKIALSGGKTATNVQISSGLSVAKAKIIALSTAAIFIIGSVILYINLSLATESEIIAQGKPAIQTPPDVNELLDKFASNQKILASFIATTEMTSDYTVSIVKGKNFHSESLTKLVIDENRAYVNYTMWGDVSPTDHYEKDIPYHKSQWWDGIGHYMYDRPNPNDFSTMAIRLNADKKYDVREKIFSGYCSCSFGMGYLPQNNGRIDEIIRKA